MDNFEHVKDKVARLETHRVRVCAVTTQLIQTGTQDAVATAFANQYEGQWVHAHGGGGFQWTGSHWALDTSKRAFHEIRELARDASAWQSSKRLCTFFLWRAEAVRG